MTYWDTSCLLKLYVQESDSDTYRDLLLQQTTPILTSALAEVEFTFAITRRESEEQLKKGATAHLAQLLRNQDKSRVDPSESEQIANLVGVADQRG